MLFQKISIFARPDYNTLRFQGSKTEAAGRNITKDDTSQEKLSFESSSCVFRIKILICVIASLEYNVVSLSQD